MTDDLNKPILAGDGASDYERYLRTDALLALQKDPSDWVHRDELLFQTVHQSSELWLKLAWNEVEEATRLVVARDLFAALRLLRRANESLKIVTTVLDMLEHMSPWEYQEIRKVLGHGSGFDSPGFREVRRVSPMLGDVFHRLRRDARNHNLRLTDVARHRDRDQRAHHVRHGSQLTSQTRTYGVDRRPRPQLTPYPHAQRAVDGVARSAGSAVARVATSRRPDRCEAAERPGVVVEQPATTSLSHPARLGRVQSVPALPAEASGDRVVGGRDGVQRHRRAGPVDAGWGGEAAPPGRAAGNRTRGRAANA